MCEFENSITGRILSLLLLLNVKTIPPNKLFIFSVQFCLPVLSFPLLPNASPLFLLYWVIKMTSHLFMPQLTVSISNEREQICVHMSGLFYPLLRPLFDWEENL